MMTDNEIVKALECCCIEHDCSKCPYTKNKGCSCINDILKDALDLINRQKAEIKKLTSGKCIYLSDDETTEYCVEGPCPNYKTEAQIKAEVYKELINLLESRLISKTKITAFGYEIAIIEIKNLLKELVGEDK